MRKKTISLAIPVLLSLVILLPGATAGERQSANSRSEHEALARSIGAHLELVHLRSAEGHFRSAEVARRRLLELVEEQRALLDRILAEAEAPPPPIREMAAHDDWRIADSSRIERGLWRVNHVPTGLDFVYLPGGEFDMGSPPTDDPSDFCLPPVRRVRVAPFLIATTEVTVSAWQCGGGAARKSGLEHPERPVRFVSAEDCRRWCERLGLRLPTEAEREYACRAGTDTPWHSGSSVRALDGVAWIRANSGGEPHSVATREPNAFGLFDMHGNVSEWCARDESGLRVYRGGCFRATARGCGSAYRYHAGTYSGRGADHIGFRPVLSPPVR